MAEHLPFDEEEFSGELPLFPLPGVVLLPGGLLSLHVFEPRYREMVKAAAEGENLIGIATLGPDYESYDGPNPPIHPMVCLGRLTRDHELPDGRRLITVHGLRRVRINDEDQSRSYRVAEVEIVPDTSGTLGLELRRLRNLIAGLAVRTPGLSETRDDDFERLLASDEETLPTARFVDIIAAVAPLDTIERLAVMSGTTVCERAHIVLEALVRIIQEREPRGLRRLLLSAPSRN